MNDDEVRAANRLRLAGGAPRYPQLGGLKHLLKQRAPALYELAWKTEARVHNVIFRARTKTFWIYELQNRRLDRRYGGDCGGAVSTRFVAAGAHRTESTEYPQLSRMFDRRKGVEVTSSDVLVDIGCGKGRVINFWLHQGWTNRMIGLELDPEIAEQARSRLRPYENVTIVTGDAVDRLPTTGRCFSRSTRSTRAS